MSSPVIKVENLSKQYRLGQVGTGSLSHDINRLWHRARGKEDPYLKIGEENKRDTKGSSDYVWALKDINFDIEQGDRVGIIGRNGAGKSTLLKILSRTTSPTTGSVKIKGRVASLLEVGTGFHPDLSGRDNIFLNGAILGMSKRDIKSRFDEIVDFAGVERYIDTPVKRYSSGMYVRLAFAVAAHLESDILIVDEVLAVGDAEFQKKCLGKMGEVSKGQGKTVLFVSHNMEAILRLCQKCLYLHNGAIKCIGSPSITIENYLKTSKKQDLTINLSLINRTSEIILQKRAYFQTISLGNIDSEAWTIKYGNPISFELGVLLRDNIQSLEIGLAIYNNNDFEIASSLSSDAEKIENLISGNHVITYSFPELVLLPGTYKIGLGIRSERGFEDYLPQVCQFEIIVSEYSAVDHTNTRKGVLVPKNQITIEPSKIHD
ncbi:ABC transporter ATP-binding protein [Daejeonella oryzae]|uniref:ABC transporter ATP-binding protein n=1 Tax=Daejeonella oryzae TaxID=1122943 RepID=UPI0004153CCB|nr:ABC transporter ATP-binding protein [Daejeonella oryzae]